MASANWKRILSSRILSTAIFIGLEFGSGASSESKADDIVEIENRIFVAGDVCRNGIELDRVDF
jgi:hypothetical protein